MPRGCCRPCDERVSQERGALETPVDPGRVPTPFGYGRHARILLQCIGAGVAGALCAKGHEKTRGKDRTSAWEGVKHREGGMALGMVGNGLVDVFDSWQGHAEWRDQGVHEEGMGDDDTLSGGQRGG